MRDRRTGEREDVAGRRGGGARRARRPLSDRAPVEAVVFDWGGTLTPWHTIDLREQWLRYAEVYDPDHADELSARILSAEDDAWRAGREHQRSATLDEIFRGVGVDPHR